MDPLTSAVTVGTVIDLSAKLLSTCYRYYREVKGAKKEIQSAIDEVSHLHVVLRSVERLGKSASPSQLTTLNQLKKPDGPLYQCQRDLSHLISRLDSHHVLTWPFKSSEVKSSLATIDQFKSTLTIALNTDQVELQLSSGLLLSSISDDMTQQKDLELRQKIITWLSTTKPSFNHNINRRKHQPGTGEWFVNGPYFDEWRTTPNSLVWLYGSAGCGKSILASTIIDYIQDHHIVQGRSALAYFYFDFNDASKQKVTNFMSSILADLCAQTNMLTDTVQQLYSKCNDGHREPLLSDLELAFLKFLPAFDTVFIVVDALDECPIKDNERQEVLQIIQDIHGHSATNLHFMMTSRQHHDIETVIAPLTSISPIHIESAMIESDIRLYVQNEVQAIRNKRAWWHVELCKEVEEALLRGANGMFRWVYCQLDTLKSCPRVAAVRQKLKKLPRDLEDTYVQMLAAIPEDYREDAHNALRWLVFSKRPLLLQELVEALRIDPQRSPPVDEEPRLSDQREILDILPNFVTFYETDYRTTMFLPTELWDFLRFESTPIHITEVKLAHFSVQEFLLSYATKASDLSPLLASVSLNHSFITEACLLYIHSYEQSEYSTEIEKDFPAFPLVHYAYHKWTYHYFGMRDQSDDIFFGSSRSVDDLFFKFCSLNTERRDWLLTFPPSGAYSHKFAPNAMRSTPLYFTSYYGLYRLAERLLDDGQEVDAKGGIVGTPLNACCIAGHRDVARLLIDHGADINQKSFDGGFTALHFASGASNVSLVQLLLDRGASAHIQNIDGEESILYACRSGDCETMKLLLDHGASTEHDGRLCDAPLLAAAEGSSHLAIELLLNRGANIDQLSGRFRQETALHRCVLNFDTDAAKLILDRGANIDIEDSEGVTPLMMAVRHQCCEMVKLLVERGADVFVRDDKGLTPLEYTQEEDYSLNIDYMEEKERQEEIIAILTKAEEAWRRNHSTARSEQDITGLSSVNDVTTEDEWTTAEEEWTDESL